jgi:hypothetical protein
VGFKNWVAMPKCDVRGKVVRVLAIRSFILRPRAYDIAHCPSRVPCLISMHHFCGQQLGGIPRSLQPGQAWYPPRSLSTLTDTSVGTVQIRGHVGDVQKALTRGAWQ